MSTPFLPYPRVADLPPRTSQRLKDAFAAANISSFEDWFNFGLRGGIGPFPYGLGERIREGALSDDGRKIRPNFGWLGGSFEGDDAIDAGINGWKSQAYSQTSGYANLKTGTTEFDGFEGKANETPEAFRKRACSYLSQQGFTVEGQKVDTPDLRRRVVLYEADANDPEGRWDCVKSMGGKWFCFYTADQYNVEKQKLKDQTDKYVEALSEGGTIGWGGAVDDAEKSRRQKELLKDLDRKAQERFNKRYPTKKELADPRDVLKVRNLNAQAALIMGMPKMRQVLGTNLVREIKNRGSQTPQESGGVIDKLNTCSLINYDGSPEALVNILANPYDVRSFLCASPAELSHLQPVLDFYLEHKDENTPSGVMHEKVCFSDHTLGDKVVQLAKARRSKKEVADDILKNRGTVGTNVGVKDFNWVFNNKHQGDKTLKASLTLHFSNVTELLNKKYLNFVFAARPHPQSRKPKKEKGWHAILKSVDKRIEFMKSGDFNKSIPPEENPTAIADIPTTGPVSQDAPRLKVLVGWADPPQNPYSVLKGQAYRDFHEAVEYTKRIVILKCHQYDLDFQQNGSVNLTLDYIGGIDAFLSNPDTSNVFDMVPMKSDELSARKVFINIFEDPDPEDIGDPGALLEKSYLASAWEKGYLHRQAKDTSNRIRTADGATRIGVSKAGLLYELKTIKMYKQYYQKVNLRNSSDKIKELDKYEGVVKTALNEVDYIHEDLIYSSLMDYLSFSGKVYYATIHKRFITGLANGVNADIDSQSSVGRRLLLGAGLPGKLKIHYKGTAAASALNRLRDRWNGAAGAARKNKITKGTANKSSASLFLDPSSDDCIDNESEPNKINLFYIRLGDLIDLLLCGMKDKPPSEMILGSFFPSLVGIPNTSDTDIYALADLPISMDYFGHWFLTNFVAIRKKPKVSFRRFVDALLMDLVAPLFNGVLYDKTAAANRGRFTFSFTSIASPVSLPSQGDVTGSGNKSPRLINEDELREAAREAGRGALTNPDAQKAYYLAYVKQIDPKLCGDPIKDYERGIVHLTIGTDRGVVKNFSFAQQQNQYFQAAKIEEGNQAGGLFLPQNAVLTCVGSTFFRNGQKIYINADFGMGEAAAQLGIGGYYTIVTVENVIEPGKFESTIHCTFTKPKWSGCTSTPKRGNETGGL